MDTGAGVSGAGGRRFGEGSVQGLGQAENGRGNVSTAAMHAKVLCPLPSLDLPPTLLKFTLPKELV